MTAQPSANDVLMGGGTAPPRIDFPANGSRAAGRIVGQPRTYHCREYAKDGQGPLRYFPSGDPIYGLLVDLQTELRDGPDDNGIRRLYVEKPRMITAIRDAVRLAGAAGLEPDAWLSVVRTGEEMGQGSMPAQTWAADYRTPAQAPVPVPAAPAPVAHQASHMPLVQHPQAPVPQHLPPGGLGTFAPTTVPPVNSPGPAPDWARQDPAPAPAAARTSAGKVIGESLAAAMRNAGVDLTGFQVVPDAQAR